MNSPNFQFPFRHFPGKVLQILSSEVFDYALGCFLFKDIGGDKGVRNACNFYWNAKKLTVAFTCSRVSPPSSFSESFVQYAVGSDMFEITGISEATNDETLMHPPMKRAGSNFASEVTSPMSMMVSKGFGTDDGFVLAASFSRVVYLTDTQRYAVLISFDLSYAVGSGCGIACGNFADSGTTVTIPAAMFERDTLTGFSSISGSATATFSFEFWTYP